MNVLLTNSFDAFAEISEISASRAEVYKQAQPRRACEPGPSLLLKNTV